MRQRNRAMPGARGVHYQGGECAPPLPWAALEVEVLYARDRHAGLALIQATAANRYAIAVDPPCHVAELAETQPQAEAAGGNDAAKQAPERGQVRNASKMRNSTKPATPAGSAKPVRDSANNRRARSGNGCQAVAPESASVAIHVPSSMLNGFPDMDCRGRCPTDAA